MSLCCPLNDNLPEVRTWAMPNASQELKAPDPLTTPVSPQVGGDAEGSALSIVEGAVRRQAHMLRRSFCSQWAALNAHQIAVEAIFR